jgi:hypothetical protein
MTQSFERYEKKYIISKTQASEMIAFLKSHMALDRHHQPDHIVPYKIHSYYLDDHDASIIKKSREKPSYKEKYRLRWYNDPTTLFLEVKIKYLKRSHKKRFEITQNDFLLKDYRTLLNTSYQYGYLNALTHATIEKYCLIDYERIAFDDANKGVRVTFDFNVSYTFDNTSYPLHDEEVVILEIKYRDAFPHFLSSYLSEHKIYPRSLSKIGRSYQQYKGALL